MCVQLCVCVAVGLSNDQFYEEEAGREEAANMSDSSAGRQQTASHQVVTAYLIFLFHIHTRSVGIDPD